MLVGNFVVFSKNCRIEITQLFYVLKSAVLKSYFWVTLVELISFRNIRYNIFHLAQKSNANFGHPSILKIKKKIAACFLTR